METEEHIIILVPKAVRDLFCMSMRFSFACQNFIQSSCISPIGKKNNTNGTILDHHQQTPDMDAPTNNGAKASDPGSSPSSCTSSQSSMVSSNWWNGLGGNVDGSFFKASPKVDPEKRPGTTSLWIQHGTREEQTVGATLWKILSLQSFLYSPNLSWLLLALCVYGLFPYELGRQQGYWEIVVERSLVNVGVCVSYIAFWHVILYSAGWSKRPFVEGRTYNWNKVSANRIGGRYLGWRRFTWGSAVATL